MYDLSKPYPTSYTLTTFLHEEHHTSQSSWCNIWSTAHLNCEKTSTPCYVVIPPCRHHHFKLDPSVRRFFPTYVNCYLLSRIMLKVIIGSLIYVFRILLNQTNEVIWSLKIVLKDCFISSRLKELTCSHEGGLRSILGSANVKLVKVVKNPIPTIKWEKN